MNKLFGEFLVEKEIVSGEALLWALIAQMKELPPICEIALEEKLFPQGDLLKIMGIQTRKECSFVDACTELGLWSPQVMESVSQRLKRVRTPIGQILVNQGATSFEKLALALDDYLSGLEDIPCAAVAPTVVAAPADPADPAPLANGRILDYCEVVSDAQRENLAAFFAAAAAPDFFIKAVAGSALLHTFSGSARYIEAKKSEELICVFEKLVEVIRRSEIPLADQELLQFGALGAEFTEVLWGLRDSLVHHGSENHALSEQSLMARYKQVIKDAVQFASRILEKVKGA